MIPDPTLQRRLASWVERDIPGRRAVTGSLAQLAAVQHGTLALMQQGIQEQQTAREAAAAPKTLASKYPQVQLSSGRTDAAEPIGIGR